LVNGPGDTLVLVVHLLGVLEAPADILQADLSLCVCVWWWLGG
jgi:hypothetical protein